GKAGDQAVGEHTDVSVVVLHGIVVAAALDGDAVFGSGQVILKGHEVFVGLEVRIIFDGGQQAAGGGIQLAGCGGLVRGGFGANQGSASGGDVTKYSLLLHGIAFDGLHQIGDQICATLQDDVDLGPCGVNGFALDDHLIAPANIGGAENERQNQENHQ